MIPRSRKALHLVGDFLRTPSVGRAVAGLLAGAFLLLLLVNIATFVMIGRTAQVNDSIEDAQQMRRAARTVLIAVTEAETAQRGFLLTGRPQYLQPFEEARQSLAPALETLHRGDTDAELRAPVDRLHEAVDAKMAEMDSTLALARQGRIGQAIQIVRSDEGRRLMDAIRNDISEFDGIKSTRIAHRVQTSERFGLITVIINTLAAVLVLVLGVISAWLVRRYVLEMQAAREALDAANASLEDKVRERTGELTRANEEIQRFAYIVSHDLRAPLVNVMGYTSELEQAGRTIDKAIARAEAERDVDPEVVQAVREDVPEAIGFIRASTTKMDRLINAILKLSREGRRTLAIETLDMTVMAQGIADSVRHQTEAADAEILVGDLPPIDSDRLSMEQIFGNLIDNAVKYLDAGRPGRIEISGEDVPGGWIVYRIIDNGRGVAPRDHERIFELFRRAGRQDRTGEGLGLAFVRNSVRRLGGQIDLESELGKGSTFLLKFPKRLVLPDSGAAL